MSEQSDWHALYRLADEHGSGANTVTQICGRNPIAELTDNGGAQARCIHDDEFEGIALEDGSRISLGSTT